MVRESFSSGFRIYLSYQNISEAVRTNNFSLPFLQKKVSKPLNKSSCVKIIFCRSQQATEEIIPAVPSLIQHPCIAETCPFQYLVTVSYSFSLISQKYAGVWLSEWLLEQTDLCFYVLVTVFDLYTSELYFQILFNAEIPQTLFTSIMQNFLYCVHSYRKNDLKLEALNFKEFVSLVG